MFAVIGAFAIFSSLKGKSNNITEVDPGKDYSSSKSSTYFKTFCSALSPQTGRNEILSRIKNVVSTETELSSQRSIHKNIRVALDFY